MFNIPDFLKIGVASFLFIFLMDRMLRAAGVPQYTTEGK